MAGTPTRVLLPTPDEHFSRASSWTAVESSNVHSVAFYLDRTRPTEPGVLRVRFHARGRKPPRTWQYEGVPLSVCVNLLAAASKGQFVHAHLKGRYSSREV